ncbi:MAG: translation initiation factor IF-2 [Saprospiraceae bacterium]
MAKRLVKIAKELNVGTSTIVDFLNANGFEIDNKPTAKISDDMYDELTKEFQKSIDIKEKSRQINIGSRNKKEEVTETVVEAPNPFSKSPEPPAAPEPEKKTAPEEQVIKADAPKIQLKKVGKIDLGQSLQKRVNKKNEPKTKPVEETSTPKAAVEPSTAPEAPVVEKVVEEKQTQSTPAEKAPVVEENKVPEAKAETPPASKTEETNTEEVKTEEVKTEGEVTPEVPKDGDALVRSKTPELRGLKILGKIDTQKFERPRKKKKKETNTPGARKERKPGGTGNSTPGTGGANKERKRRVKEGGPDKPADAKSKTTTGTTGTTGDQPQRKRRRRKKITIETNNSGGERTRRERSPNAPQGRNTTRRAKPKQDVVKEVSQKEIEEKIKATMARLQGGGKNRRRKLNRDKRDRHKEKQEQLEAQQDTTGKLEVTEFISVSELASIMNVGITDVITTCMNLGIIVSINQRLDAEVIELVAGEFDFEVDFINAEEQISDDFEDDFVDDPADLIGRNPIVTVMGHVDHGKTSLLDYIRDTKVADGEAGGITQHIGAYEVKTENGQGVTFLDTPGHEAFTAMRARGAKVTDIAIIIIAADDNVMPQTKEAISHAQAAGVPMVFAINKIDKDGAQPERIKQELASMNILVESWGGSFQSQDISAKSGEGIDELIEKVLLEAEILELKANPVRKASGTVLEASLDKGRGYVTKVLVQNGTLGIGDPIVAGEYAGKIKAMLNERGKRIKTAGPSKPVMILGLSGAPQAGELFKEMAVEQDAKQLANKRAQLSREQANRATKRISLDEIGRRLALGTFKELNLIVKGDVDGSVEALSDSLIKLSVETVQVNVIHKAVGQIIESDVLLASASDAIIIGFQVRPSLNARRLAEKEGVQIKTYSIIYETIEEIKMAIEGMLEPTKEEKILGEVEVRDIFKISRVGTVAGGFVKDGKVARNNHIRLIRDGIVVYPTKEGAHGKLASLKRFKDDVKEVKNGLECGLSIENFNDLKVGDTVEAYEIIEIKQTLD